MTAGHDDTLPGDASIGLRRHTVRLVDHDPAWAIAGASECRRLRESGGELILDAQHIGSTSVPDLPAKPILDIAVLLESPDHIARLVEQLAPAGYLYRGDHGDEGGHLFVRDSQPDVRVAHVHVFALGDRQWDECLGFRDALRADAALREQYAALKRDLLARHANDRPSYTAGKAAFIREALTRFA